MSIEPFRLRGALAPALLVFLFLIGSCCPPNILTESLPEGRVGDSYLVALRAECTGGFWWVGGELPPGLSFNSDGVFSGIPRYAGLYFLTVTWEDQFEGEILSSVSRGFDLLILQENEPLLGEGQMDLDVEPEGFVF